MIFDFDTLVPEEVLCRSNGEHEAPPSRTGTPKNRAGELRWAEALVMAVCISISWIGFRGATTAEAAGVPPEAVMTAQQGATAKSAAIVGARVAPNKLEVVRSIFESDQRPQIPDGEYPLIDG